MTAPALQTPYLFPKPSRWRSRPYLDWVKGFLCIGCPKQKTKTEPHHVAHPRVLRDAHGKGMAQKHSDQWVVPVCRRCHDHFESKGFLPNLSVAESYELVAVVQLELLSRYVQYLDELQDCF